VHSLTEGSVHTNKIYENNKMKPSLHKMNLKHFVFERSRFEIFARKPDVLISEIFFNFLIPSIKNVEKVVSNQPRPLPPHPFQFTIRYQFNTRLYITYAVENLKINKPRTESNASRI
jgi:hypothetical protein